MQTCILLFGILLTSQVGGRYDPLNDQAQNHDHAGHDHSEHAHGSPAAAGMGTPLATPGSVLPPESPAYPAETAAETTAAASVPAYTPAAEPPATTASPRTPRATVTPTRGLTQVIKPAKLLRDLSRSTGNKKLVGRQVTLAEVVDGARLRGEQSRRVYRYWELSQAVVEYHLASLEELQLQSVLSGLPVVNEPWDFALQAAISRRQVCRSAVKLAQYRLQKVMGRAGEPVLPLPSDEPHCGAYEAKYERIFQGRTSREAEQLTQLLPLRHRELADLAAETKAAEQWYARISQQGKGENDLLLLVKAYERLAHERRAFVAAAYQYNADIARYTELAVPQQIGTGRLVSMLIQTDISLVDGWQPPGQVRPASAEGPVGSSRSDGGRPRTFAEEPAGSGRKESFRAAPSNPRSTQRSIVVPIGESK